MKVDNPLIQILDILTVQYTIEYTVQFYESHPNKYNLLGLSQMLDAYQIENIGVNAEKKAETIRDIQLPFLACVSNRFVIVTHLTNDKISYLFEDNNITISVENFLKIWSGDILLFAATDESQEPEYSKHLRSTILNRIQVFLSGMALFFVFVWVCFNNWNTYDNGVFCQMLVNGIGIALCIPLMRVQINNKDAFAKKVCSLLSDKSKCNEVTNSPASKLFGVSLSSYGMAYFTVNLLFLLAYPAILPSVSLINLFVLPFTLWSIWYQVSRLKELCSLCIGVQICIWLIFVVNLGSRQLFYFDFVEIALTCCGYLVALFGIHTYSQFKIVQKEAVQYTHQLYAIKLNFSVFNILLQEQSHYEINTDIGLMVGNPNSTNIVTVISNPHCDPCSRLHPTIVDLLNQSNIDFRIQFILTSFSKELEASCHLWIAMYQNSSSGQFMEFIDTWYSDGRYSYPKYYHKYASFINNNKVKEAYMQQTDWLEKTQITNTPTVLVNGFLLPEQYELEDLIRLEMS